MIKISKVGYPHPVGPDDLPPAHLLYYFIPSTDIFYTILFSRIPSSVPSHVILIFPFFNKNNINLFYGVYYRVEGVILIGMCKAKPPNHSDASPHQGIHKQQPSWILNLHIYNVVIDVESSCSCEKKTYGFIHVIKHQRSHYLFICALCYLYWDT